MRAVRVVVCGTKFGRVYLSAFRHSEPPFELAGILAKGSARSHACAEHYGVPLFTAPGQLPSTVDVACVVVGPGVNGGCGADLARELMARRIHVLQEHPLHHDELAECLRTARCHGVAYQVNTHWVHLAPVRRFIAAAKGLIAEQSPLFVDAVCGFQTAYSLFDILGRSLGRLRPWSLKPLSAADACLPFRTVEGVVAGVPATLRIQNQVAVDSPDNHVRLFHRIAIGTEGGTLTLVNSHGPIIWCPATHMPADSHDLVAYDDSPAAHLAYLTAEPISRADAPSYLEILREVWPAGIRQALGELQRAISTPEEAAQTAQYYLTLSRVWQETAARLGPPVPIAPRIPEVLSAAAFTEDPLCF